MKFGASDRGISGVIGIAEISHFKKTYRRSGWLRTMRRWQRCAGSFLIIIDSRCIDITRQLPTT
jgi:hypothetical protein